MASQLLDDLVKFAIPSLLASGGPLALWVGTRTRQAGGHMTQRDVDRAEHPNDGPTSDDLDRTETRWREYATDIERRLGAQIEALEVRLDAQSDRLVDALQRVDHLERRDRAHYYYELTLRDHIDRGMPPPAPPWPHGMEPNLT